MLIQRGIIITCKSTYEERIKQNFEVFDFTLSDMICKLSKHLIIVLHYSLTIKTKRLLSGLTT